MSHILLNILVSPLDWGLGHASRCVPVIKQLLQAGHNVTLAAGGRSKMLLVKEFPQLEFIELPGFSPGYSKSGNMALHLFLLLPQFISSIIRDHMALKKLIPDHKIDLVISDNRYGLWNTNVKSILITHQVMVKTPVWLRFAEYPLYLISRLLINRFDECWIPDIAMAPGLSGDLSHKYSLPANAKFIGLLSRINPDGNHEGSQTSENKKISVIISGPEPQRSIFEELVIAQLSKLNHAVTIIRGKPETEQVIEIKGNLKLISHTGADETKSVIKSSALVICRSGYSTVMDLAVLKSRALFVPTPGQTEQIYLAEVFKASGIAYSNTQKKLNLKEDIEKAMLYPGFKNLIIASDLFALAAHLKKQCCIRGSEIPLLHLIFLQLLHI